MTSKKMTNNINSPWPSLAVTPELLMGAAREVQFFSYSPYSHFAVGAALLLSDDNIITGCNVENSSYSLTLCAERSTIVQMVARGEKSPLALAVVGTKGKPCYPCGACRQVLWEFNPEMILVFENGENKLQIVSLRELFPYPFGREDLQD
ncbi:MAG: cytidine deaminase [Aminobacterium sp.]|jgi:cytidine deaminase|uniref:cytidine deaminase n=1 Tax=unclassified Aminobacterium TaxID=2685012 RepID=UPI001BCF5765|nr:MULTISPECIES: cytidine deaminase [unclassified Aminobacterium]MDD2206571.1 cytidine deaminase [Aminobacterium sp.]MDD3426201.1 cytidine deaminase [Aminobacterium sp.]MDD3707367.1 cytidine deaminase [Aminobacterium sp.]MDD4228490.1 cytidine deaminase [Aminobacterium sp.]MDD4551413.1 cytidine deaminase [Aminobacterium sp.]